MCNFELEHGKKCPLEQHTRSRFCILHTPFPSDKTVIEYQQLLELKNQKIKEKIESGNFDFRGVKIQHFTLSSNSKIEDSILFNMATIEGNVLLRGVIIQGDALFKNAFIKGNVTFEGATIEGNARFFGAKIRGDVLFNNAKIQGDAWFRTAKIQGDASFNNARIKGDATFWGATVESNVTFDGATIEGDAMFWGATIEGDATFRSANILGDASFKNAIVKGNATFKNAIVKGNATFEGATIEGNATFEGATIEGNAQFTENENIGMIKGDIRFISTKIVGELIFSDSFFLILHAKEQINRYAKKLCEERGEKYDADKYFFKEMDIRRKQKSWKETRGQSRNERVKKGVEYALEWPLKYLFFYGVYPIYSFFIWIVLIFAFAIVYYLFAMIQASSFWDYLYFSVINSMMPGYGGAYLNPGIPRLIASVEAMFGTFMWASFIVILLRKFMR
jgi:uncharacterized protein YjbI with pentapeptide repeats